MMETVKREWMDWLTDSQQADWFKRKCDLLEKRNAELAKISGSGRLYQTLKADRGLQYRYLLHLSYLIKQGEAYYLEEEIRPMQFIFADGALLEHREADEEPYDEQTDILFDFDERNDGEIRFNYDRREAVRYAERWWNDYNPAFRKFEVDCTNYVSQCLLAGGAPMHGAPVRSRGWWYGKNSWSYSWAVAHSFRWYLSGSQSGLRGVEVEKPEDLQLGDVICYDFEGDGKWNHNTIVVAKDAAGMPLVNAHTNNSRNRYWSYEDSAAWTPQCQYKFFRIASG